MSKCLLCRQREADKTGSHIIPSFLMKRINGDGKRDHEIGFKIKQARDKHLFITIAKKFFINITI